MGSSAKPVMTSEEFRLLKDYVASKFGLKLEAIIYQLKGKNPT